MSAIYLEAEKGLYVVGFMGPGDSWQPDSDHSKREAAAARVNFLNGGSTPHPLSKIDWERLLVRQRVALEAIQKDLVSFSKTGVKPTTQTVCEWLAIIQAALKPCEKGGGS